MQCMTLSVQSVSIVFLLISLLRGHVQFISREYAEGMLFHMILQ